MRLRATADIGPLICGALAVLVLMLIPLDRFDLLRQWPALREELQNIGHPIAFMALALIGRRTMRRSLGLLHARHYLLLAVSLGAFAALTEVLQGLTGRDGSFRDFTGDLLGICAGLLWLPQNKLAMRTAALAALLACASLMWTICAYLYRQQQTPVIWRADSALLNRFAHWQGGNYPGLVLQEVPADWRAFRTLILVVRNPDSQVAPFTIRIHDADHDERYTDRFHRTFMVAAHSTGTFHIPLEDVAAGPVGRSLDLAALDGMVVFQQASEATAGFAPSEIRLAR